MRMTANDAPMHIGEVFREMLEAKPVTVTLIECKAWRARITPAQCQRNLDLPKYERPTACNAQCENKPAEVTHDPKHDHICKSCGQGAIRRPGIGLCDNCFKRQQRAAKREARA